MSGTLPVTRPCFSCTAKFSVNRHFGTHGKGRRNLLSEKRRRRKGNSKWMCKTTSRKVPRGDFNLFRGIKKGDGPGNWILALFLRCFHRFLFVKDACFWSILKSIVFRPSYQDDLDFSKNYPCHHHDQCTVWNAFGSFYRMKQQNYNFIGQVEKQSPLFT